MLTFPGVWPTQCMPLPICMCRCVGGFFGTPTFFFFCMLLHPVPPQICAFCPFILASLPHFSTGYGPWHSLIHASDLDINFQVTITFFWAPFSSAGIFRPQKLAHTLSQPPFTTSILYLLHHTWKPYTHSFYHPLPVLLASQFFNGYITTLTTFFASFCHFCAVFELGIPSFILVIFVLTTSLVLILHILANRVILKQSRTCQQSHLSTRTWVLPILSSHHLVLSSLFRHPHPLGFVHVFIDHRFPPGSSFLPPFPSAYPSHISVLPHHHIHSHCLLLPSCSFNFPPGLLVPCSSSRPQSSSCPHSFSSQSYSSSPHCLFTHRRVICLHVLVNRVIHLLFTSHSSFCLYILTNGVVRLGTTHFVVIYSHCMYLFMAYIGPQLTHNLWRIIYWWASISYETINIWAQSTGPM